MSKLTVPVFLLKPLLDPFAYLLRTKSGCTFFFEQLEIVNLEEDSYKDMSGLAGLEISQELYVKLLNEMNDSIPVNKYLRIEEPFDLKRGVVLKVSDIEFIIDAPFGS